MVHRFAVHAPDARNISLFVQRGRDSTVTETVMTRPPEGPTWSSEVEAQDGDVYWFVVDGVGPLLDPDAMDVVWTAEGPRSVVRTTWPKQPSLGRHHVDPVVYEVHVRGFGTTFVGCGQHLPYLADLGVDVIEVMPVHPFDSSHNYWGYMPLVWGAVHRPYAEGGDAPNEMAQFVAAAHALDMEVWLDVVFNHTGEGDVTKPTLALRGFDDAHAYLRRADGSYNDDSGTGNVSNSGDPNIRRLILTALDRFADLGIDGFRFDLASLLTRDGGGLVEQITEWAARRNVRLIAEPWDLAAYQLGKWAPPWLQWNDRFRDDVRGFVRGEPGKVTAVVQRVQGSPDLFADAGSSVNFITAHDGLTMHDLTLVTSDHHHSWNTGPALRMQQLKNYFTILLLSSGTPMFVMGDEFARTQQGLDNPFDIDSPVTWIDWSRLDAWKELHGYVQTLLRVRRFHPPADFHFYGATQATPDTGWESRSIAWSAGGLYVMANAWWEPVKFELREEGPWEMALHTSGTAPESSDVGSRLEVAPRSITVLRRAVVSGTCIA